MEKTKINIKEDGLGPFKKSHLFNRELVVAPVLPKPHQLQTNNIFEGWFVVPLFDLEFSPLREDFTLPEEAPAGAIVRVVAAL